MPNVVNVASVPQYSPFRYPGGKSTFIPHIRQWLAYRSRPSVFIEPFCGGGSVGLSVALEDLAEHVIMVERDPAVAAVWQVIVHGTPDDVAWLINRIDTFRMTSDAVDAVLADASQSLLQQAFATIIRNRVNHGGCLAKGTGRIKNGENGKGLSSRWYPQALVQRITCIRQVRQRITFLHADGLHIIQQLADYPDHAWFIDPPYVTAGRRLYDYSTIDHANLFMPMTDVRGDFLMTYDDNPAIRGYAQDNQLTYTALALQNKQHIVQRDLLIGRNLDWVQTNL